MDISQLSKIIMGTEEAAKEWDLSQDHVKKLCRLGKCHALQVGRTWILLKNQPNPKKNAGNI
ncbi:hypothetical protein [Paenibacillus eucommiae]|uniref:DNA-binding protein n=1 Tax=Paenibacillus eucommiae TaxID=1355755 RepID=A0ABS4IXW1_9BACL|nr:hypothetical protein [Paenibacillus eucommiae]MBP1991394.1 hypothetical protein [Paenibacillus eucommiae]